MIKPTLRPPLYMLIIFIAFWTVFALVFGIREACKGSNDFIEIQKRGVLRICGEEDHFSFYTEKDSLRGFYYEIAKAFADKHHLNLVYISENSLKKRLELLDAGACDIVSGPLPVVSDLTEQVSYSLPIIESKLVLIQRRSEQNKNIQPIRNQVDLRGKHIAVGESSPSIERLHHLEAEISDTIYIRELVGYNSEKMIAMVAAGLEDFAVCDKQVAKAYLKRYPSIDIETSVGFNQLQAWGVKPGKKMLLDSLNLFLSDYKKSPAFTRLLQKYIAN
jgi:membrane-bound lytic murein transglycosylase MltF